MMEKRKRRCSNICMDKKYARLGVHLLYVFLKDYECIIIIFQGWVSQNYSKIYHKTYLKIDIRSDLRQS